MTILVLTRGSGQEIILSSPGNEDNPSGEHFIKIHVVKVSSGKVRIGIEAPDGITILRGELVQGEIKCESN